MAAEQDNNRLHVCTIAAQDAAEALPDKIDGHEVDLVDCASGEALLNHMASQVPDAVLMGVKHATGKESLLEKVLGQYHDMPVIVLGEDPSVETVVECIKKRAEDFVPLSSAAEKLPVEDTGGRAEAPPAGGGEPAPGRLQLRRRQAGRHGGREPVHARDLRDHQEHRAHGRHRADNGRERHGQGDGGRGRPRSERHGRRAATGSSWPSTAPPSRRTCWRASCSATRRAPSPAPTSSASAPASAPTGARCSWTRSAR